MTRLPSISSLTRPIGCLRSVLDDGVDAAGVVALAADDAELLVDHVLDLPAAGDGFGRAGLQAERAAVAVVRDREGQQLGAVVRRALPVGDVGLVLRAEVL